MVAAVGRPGSRDVLVAERLSKRFVGVRALTEVDLAVRGGEVLALMGENGAGKSTLLRIINGDYRPDEGSLRLDGAETRHSSPAAAHRAGIRVIAQEPEIIPDVDVTENVYAGALPQRGRIYSRGAAREKCRDDLERLGLTGLLEPGTLGRRLSPAQRQLVEIMRGLVGDVRVVAFDEPTSSLSDHEVDILFGLIRRLRDEGVAVIYVSHRMKEIFQIADRIAVLRDGRLVGVRQAGETDEDELVRMMVGRELQAMTRPERVAGEVVLAVSGVTSADVRDVSFEVRRGEVVALAGLVGAGRSELVKAVVGDLPLLAGTVSMNGRRLRLRSPRDAIRAGIGFAPEERKAEALILERSVRENVSLAVLDRMRRFRFVQRGREQRVVNGFLQSLRIKTPSAEQQVRKLSGGNQQKVVLARWLAREPDLLILDEPTRGVDVGAKAEIYAVINELAADGTAILIVSSELPEVIALADRILVMREGRLAGELGAGPSEEEILRLAMKHDEQIDRENES
ncbi:L-arabinose transport system ATP-binding protein [Kribbella aluminosa]|uniref:L-arabinose transport system ATP-binding protein n=1 Tax=Kribbella aluminosa TaxID=416017 RepID=A0ABS4UX21_9ACTN|nr:sugar ABC transporter ATP-binding protein [Kribbella aluminosa]MBP2356177.1 L-arabinose transport system ATP-binding protein [Kribbella aluminosa]